MVNPRVPHLFGVTLDSNGVAGSQVLAINKTTQEKQRKATDSNKIAIFDAAEFTSGYSASDVIQFRNVGSSVGQSEATISDATGGLQEVSITCAAAPTVAVNL